MGGKHITIIRKKTTETLRTLRNTEMITQRYINEISYRIIGCAFEVHKQVGAGLLETVYEAYLIDEMKSAGLILKSNLRETLCSLCLRGE